MVMLFGERLSRRQVSERAGMVSQFAGVRLMTLGDGVERDVRIIEFRTGTGLRFTVMVDRGFDIGDCEHRGRSIGWHSPAGFRHPGLSRPEEEGGLGWLRAMSGLLVTCGLDHILSSETASAAHFNYPGRKDVNAILHGRVSMIPGRLTGYGETWDGDECTLWCEGIVQQSTVFGEDLHLIRRIEADIGGDAIRLTDRVVNHGFYKTPHMYLYHINLGYPLLDAEARYVAPIREVIWAAHAGEDYARQNVGYRRMSWPRPDFREQVWQHDMAGDDSGCVRVALMNDRLALGFEVETLSAQLPAHYQWQNFQAGQYTIGIEPATNHVLGRRFAEERSELIWLAHGEERRYDTVFRVLDGPAALIASEQRIRAAAEQPVEDYPAPTGRFPAIGAR
jgi:hypothetical protein